MRSQHALFPAGTRDPVEEETEGADPTVPFEPQTAV